MYPGCLLDTRRPYRHAGTTFLGSRYRVQSKYELLVPVLGTRHHREDGYTTVQHGIRTIPGYLLSIMLPGFGYQCHIFGECLASIAVVYTTAEQCSTVQCSSRRIRSDQIR